jgi:hypothetical protein
VVRFAASQHHFNDRPAWLRCLPLAACTSLPTERALGAAVVV